MLGKYKTISGNYLLPPIGPIVAWPICGPIVNQDAKLDKSEMGGSNAIIGIITTSLGHAKHEKSQEGHKHTAPVLDRDKGPIKGPNLRIFYEKYPGHLTNIDNNNNS